MPCDCRFEESEEFKNFLDKKVLYKLPEEISRYIIKTATEKLKCFRCDNDAKFEKDEIYACLDHSYNIDYDKVTMLSYNFTGHNTFDLDRCQYCGIDLGTVVTIESGVLGISDQNRVVCSLCAQDHGIIIENTIHGICCRRAIRMSWFQNGVIYCGNHVPKIQWKLIK